MNYEAYCYALGHTLTWFFVGLITFAVALNLWYYLSTASALWLARVLSDWKRPGRGGVNPGYRKMLLWRLRMLLRITLDWRIVLQAHGNIMSSGCWEVNLTGFFPKVRVK